MTAKFLREFLSCLIVSAVAEVCFCRSAGLRVQSIATADLQLQSITVNGLQVCGFNQSSKSVGMKE